MKKKSFYSLKETTYRFLFEQEEEGEETAEDAIFGGGEEDEAAGDEAAGDDEAAEDEGEGTEEEEIDVSVEEKYKFRDSIDNELDALLVDFEEEARKSAAVNTPDDLVEVIYRRLFEGAAEDIDLRSFASNIARLVQNYQNLIDWQEVILNKVETFVNNHYGEETVGALFDILEGEYNIAKENKKEESPEPPFAAGAYGEGGGA